MNTWKYSNDEKISGLYLFCSLADRITPPAAIATVRINTIYTR
jgi:hypothetical protein